MVSSESNEVLGAMKYIMKSAKYSDLTISCGGKEFPVHRAIVCPRSPFFAAACDGEFLEAKLQRISLPEDDPEIVECVISYLYTLDYCDEEEDTTGNIIVNTRGGHNISPVDDQAAAPVDATIGNDSDTDDTIPTKSHEHENPFGHEKKIDPYFRDVRVYALAEKYDIPDLKDVAKSKFLRWAENNWSHEAFPTVVREIYESTPASDCGLREVAVQLIFDHVEEVIERKGFRELFEDVGELGLAIIVQLSRFKVKQLSAEQKMKEALGALESEVASMNAALKSATRTLNSERTTNDADLRKAKSELNSREDTFAALVKYLKEINNCFICGRGESVKAGKRFCTCCSARWKSSIQLSNI
ncbi:MAG: hypothetical protein M1834_009510 [Cirrosporium novae-zelandiae]|nr:MAG: hypothetical protein M1834_009510 [Cirrosporium novae-zelandiae]